MGIWFCKIEFSCPKQWDELSITDHPRIRSCEACGKHVHFVDTTEQLSEAAMEGMCVAFYNADESEMPEGLPRTIRRSREFNEKSENNSGTRKMTIGLLANARPLRIDIAEIKEIKSEQ